MCSDGFLFANNAMTFFEDIFFRGKHSYTFKIPNYQQEDQVIDF